MVEDNNPVVASVCQVVLKMDLAANGADGPPLLPFGLTQLQRLVKSLESIEIRNKTAAKSDLTYLVKCTETSHIFFDCFEGQVTTFQLFS